MDVVYGGGKYGKEAVKWLIENSREFVVIDVDENCLVNREINVEKFGGRFVRGEIQELLEIVEEVKPEYIFPTAPIHIAASLISKKFDLEVWNEGVNYVLSGIPAKIIVSAGRGSVVVSYNRDYTCLPKCSAPEVCPVTKIKKPAPMYSLLEFAIPEGFVIKTIYLRPGLGAIKGEEILELFRWAEKRDKIFIATACRCHGVVTALKRRP